MIPQKYNVLQQEIFDATIKFSEKLKTKSE